MDIIEIDGASNRGIDEIRDLRERVMLAPARGRYKVYIIDEVHMLTPEAFNALLKTLEEPPLHVVFIFATTEPHKLPATILSRCQRFDFRRISTQDILKQLQYICDKEGITSDSNGLLLIARAAQGGMRDAEGVLDQVMSYTGGKEVKRDDVLVVMGMVPEDVLVAIINAIINQNGNVAVEMVNVLINKGVDMSQLTRDVISHLRNLLMVKIGCGEGVLDITTESKDILKEQSMQLSVESILKAIDCLREANEQMKYAYAQAGTILETTMVRLCRIQTEIPLSEIIEKLSQMEQRMATSYPELYEKRECSEHLQVRPLPHELYEEKVEEKEEYTETERHDDYQSLIPISTEMSLEKIIQLWPAVTDTIRIKRPPVASHLSCGRIVNLSDNILTIEFDSSFHKSGVDKPEYRELIEAKIHEKTGKALKIKTVLAQEQKTLASTVTVSQTKKMPSIHPVNDPRIERVMDMFEGNRVT